MKSNPNTTNIKEKIISVPAFYIFHNLSHLSHMNVNPVGLDKTVQSTGNKNSDAVERNKL